MERRESEQLDRVGATPTEAGRPGLGAAGRGCWPFPDLRVRVWFAPPDRMEDHIIRCILGDPLARVVAVLSTGTAREVAQRHGAVGGAQVALGRGVTAGLLLATLTKGHERVTVQVGGGGVLGQLMIDATEHGVRAMLGNPHALVSVTPGERPSIGDAIGRRGHVSVLRDLGLEERFTGRSPLVSGEIDDDIESYLCTSEQIDSALGCEVDLATTTDVRVAAGVLVQCMPGGEAQELVADVRRRLRDGALMQALGAGDYAEDIARAILGDAAGNLEVLDLRPVRFECPCSEERARGALAAMPSADLEEMIREDGGAEITCDFCRDQYRFPEEALAELLAARSASS